MIAHSSNAPTVAIIINFHFFARIEQIMLSTYIPKIISNFIIDMLNGIALALRETHKDDFFSVPEDNPLKEMLETAGEIVSQDSDTEQAYLAFICKRLKLNFRKLSVEERKWLKKIAEKSDLLKNPKPQRGRR